MPPPPPLLPSNSGKQMAADQKGDSDTFQKEEEKEFDLVNDVQEAPLPLTVTSRVLYMLGDITAGPAFRFAQWLELVRKRSSKYPASGSPIGLNDWRVHT